jgi:DNA-binding MarR family transcriptional regulator
MRLKLTTAGRRLHEKVLARALERNERVMSALTPEDARTLFGLLDKLQPFMTHRAERVDQKAEG